MNSNSHSYSSHAPFAKSRFQRFPLFPIRLQDAKMSCKAAMSLLPYSRKRPLQLVFVCNGLFPKKSIFFLKLYLLKPLWASLILFLFSFSGFGKILTLWDSDKSPYALPFTSAFSAPFSTMIRMVSPSSTLSPRISLAARVSTYFWI